MVTALNHLAPMSSAGHNSRQQELCDKLQPTTCCDGMHKHGTEPYIIHDTSPQLLPSAKGSTRQRQPWKSCKTALHVHQKPIMWSLAQCLFFLLQAQQVPAGRQ